MLQPVPHRWSGGWTGFQDGSVALAQMFRERGGGPPECLNPDPRTRFGISSSGEAPPQVWVDADARVAVLADARLDNARELLARLSAHEEQDRGGVSGLLGAAYLRWGVASFSYLRGDFAALIWDPVNARLILGRDPMGMRGLYYRPRPDGVLVATEAKQIRSLPGVPQAPDQRMAAAFLTGCFGAADWSYHEGIRQVKPGHVLVYSPNSERELRIWELAPDESLLGESRERYEEVFRDLFLDSVRARLKPAGPAGIFLSGGVDSGAIASAVGYLGKTQELSASLSTYSWDFGALEQCDERHLSRLITDHYGLPAWEVRADDAGPFSGYPEIPGPDLDDPIHSPFQSIMERGFRVAQNHGVGTLFTGMRGDLVAGPLDMDYRSLIKEGRWMAAAEELRIHAHALGAPLPQLLGHEVIQPAWSRFREVGWRRLRTPSVGRAASPPADGFPGWIRSDWAAKVGLEEILAEYREPPAPPGMTAFQSRRFQLLSMPMHQKMATAHERRVARHGLHASDPWSDVRLARLAVSIPQPLLNPEGRDGRKELVRRSLNGIMPPPFAQGADKIVPLPLYLHSLREEGRPGIRQLLTRTVAEERGWVDGEALRTHYEDFLGGQPLHGWFWWALSLEWWLSTHWGL